jgi:hypothetical protein
MLRLWDSGATNSLPPATYITGHMTSIAKPLPPLELLQELFEISADSPSGLIWKISRSPNVKPGQVAGAKLTSGYWHVTVTTDTKKQYRNHRIIYFLQTGKDPGTSQIDHIFGKHDNLNLRLATSSENSANVKKIETFMGKKCSSQFKGVRWHKKNKKWEAKLRFQGKYIYLGHFKNETGAALAYNKAAVEYFGEFAKINEVEQ